MTIFLPFLFHTQTDCNKTCNLATFGFWCGHLRYSNKIGQNIQKCLFFLIKDCITTNTRCEQLTSYLYIYWFKGVFWTTPKSHLLINLTAKGICNFKLALYFIPLVILNLFKTRGGFCHCVDVCMSVRPYIRPVYMYTFWFSQFLVHARSNSDQTWYKDATWEPLNVHEVKGHISRSKIML